MFAFYYVTSGLILEKRFTNKIQVFVEQKIKRNLKKKHTNVYHSVLRKAKKKAAKYKRCVGEKASAQLTDKQCGDSDKTVRNSKT